MRVANPYTATGFKPNARKVDEYGDVDLEEQNNTMKGIEQA